MLKYKMYQISVRAFFWWRFKIKWQPILNPDKAAFAF